MSGGVASLAGRLLARSSPGNSAMVAEQVEDLRATGKRTYQDTLRELSRTDLRGRLPEVKVPTLVLCGERDRANLPGA